jgi:hypothetical protein
MMSAKSVLSRPRKDSLCHIAMFRSGSCKLF